MIISNNTVTSPIPTKQEESCPMLSMNSRSTADFDTPKISQKMLFGEVDFDRDVKSLTEKVHF